MGDIKSEFLDEVSYYSNGPMAATLWAELEKAYSSKKRFYHNLPHLNNLIDVLTPFKNRFRDWAPIIFSIAYHDIVYNVLKSDNEEKSAHLAGKRLRETSSPLHQIEYCCQLILATKQHTNSDYETNLFTDADLNVLGANRETYIQYSENIRKEYSIFPDLIYNAGRKKVLMRFLEMNKIFKTEEFNSKYEIQARINLEWELSILK